LFAGIRGKFRRLGETAGLGVSEAGKESFGKWGYQHPAGTFFDNHLPVGIATPE
jgi:hypothetical protein